MFNIKAPKKYLALSIALSLPVPLFAQTASEEETPPQHMLMEDVQRFSNALNLIKKYYVKPTDDNQLFNNALKGMVGGLDPHSSYLDSKELEELQTSTAGEFGGLGIELTMENGLVKVITPLDDTPAYKAGIKASDYIIKIGNQSLEGIELQDTVALMRGKPGSTVELTILRKGEKKPLTFALIREQIQIKSVKSKLFDNQYAYVRISQFQAQTAKDLEQAIAKLKQQAGGNVKGLILDLRNNPGGLLDSAIEVSDDFLDNDKSGKKETIVYTQGRLPGSKFTAYVKPGDLLNNAPMIVLINNGSASASEIVAGALKDYKRAIIVGTRSFGKGSVQTILPLDDKRAIKLTTALYYTPSGTSIQAKGITPDIIIEEINIPKDASKKDGFNTSEAELNGHISNKNNDETDPSKASKSDDDLSIMHEDYQLYAAFTILKGLAVAKR